MPTLAVKYRPTTFNDIVEQDVVKKILENQIKMHTLRNAYLFVGSAGCVDKDTEYFNGSEWKKISDYKEGEKVLQYDTKTGVASLVTPIRYIKEPCDSFNIFKTKYGIDMWVSDEHRVLYKTKKGDIKEISAKDLFTQQTTLKAGFRGKFIVSFSYSGKGIDLSDDEIALMCAVICDGSFPSKNNSCVVSLKKQRKKDRLELLLQKLNIQYLKKVKGEGFHRYYFKSPIRTKIFDEEFYNCSQHQLQVICDNILFWDGSIKNGRKTFTQRNKKTIDFVQFAFASCGYRTSLHLYKRMERDLNYVNVFGIPVTYHYKDELDYVLNITCKKSNTPSLGQSKALKQKSLDGFKYCFTVPSHAWVMRRNGNILITGNCGKTTSARCFANAINNGKGSPIEIDASSNNGVDNIRNLIEQSKYFSLDSEYKIFILDEVHSLTNQSWQSLLKLLEETPAKTIFILCTTEPQKIPQTILSRVQRFNFQKISLAGIEKRLKYIVKNEFKTNKFSDDAINFIAKQSMGGMRDAITSLDKCASYYIDDQVIGVEEVINCLGVADYENLFLLLQTILFKDIEDNELFKIIDNTYNVGKDLKVFIQSFIQFVIDIIKFYHSKDINSTLLPSTDKWVHRFKTLINIDGVLNDLKEILKDLITLQNEIKGIVNIKAVVESDLYLLRGNISK